MRKAFHHIAFLLLILTYNSNIVRGQVSDTITVNGEVVTEVRLYSIVLFNGRRFFGQIVSETANQILFNDVKVGKVYINRAEIRSMIVKKTTHYNKNMRHSYFESIDYGFAPHSTVLPKGDISIYSLYGIVNKVEFGLSKNVGFGFSNAALLGPSAVNLKLCKSIDSKVHISTGIYLGIIPFDLEGISYTYVGVTMGDSKNSFSINYGYGSNTFATNSTLTILAFNTQFAHKWSLMGEAYLAQKLFTQIGLLGCRYTTSGNLSWDFGLTAVENNNSLDQNSLPVIVPFIAAKYRPKY